MKQKIFLFLIIFLSACHNGDINQVHKGMSADKVISIIGKPDNKMTMPMGVQWWNYKQGTVVIKSDTVSDVRTPETEKADQLETDSINRVDSINEALHQRQEDSTNAFMDSMNNQMDSLVK